MSIRLERGLDPEDPPGFESSTSEEMKKERAQKNADKWYKRWYRKILRLPDPPEVLAARAEAEKNYLEILELKKKGIDPFRAKGIMSSIQAEEPEEEESDSSSSYVSTSDSDERRERKYRERMARTKAKLDFDIAALRTRVSALVECEELNEASDNEMGVV